MPPQTATELLQRYASGERTFKGLGAEKDFTGDFRNAQLEGVILSGCIVADFTGANLRNASFSGNLKTCLFRNANLSGACFRGALIDATDFSGARLDATDFCGASESGYVYKENEKPRQVL